MVVLRPGEELTDRDELILQAQLAEEAERYDDMMKFMTDAVKLHSKLNQEERRLLYHGFRNAAGIRRTSIFVLKNSEDVEIDKGKVQAYVDNINHEVWGICKCIIELLDQHIIPANDTKDDRAFYLKMKADYYRYMAEIERDNGDVIDNAQTAYTQGLFEAENSLPPMDQTRLALVLNLSVFCHDILGDTEEACCIVESTLDDLSGREEFCPPESVIPLHMLRDNLQLWTQETAESEDELVLSLR
ncbi:14-3-3 protein sigma-like [Mya arenaria]|uniref:14-3-3 protein sigma-like n=1 Tax=Mya arenaria TaxID=6604 RepID=UPI0022E70DFE|nr:14-3-3 protein sigma-like [Mya arenaria]